MLFGQSSARKMKRWGEYASLGALILLLYTGLAGGCDAGDKTGWIDRHRDQWPRIAMINHIEYADTLYPIAGCSFLLDTGEDTLAVTAKHVLTYFKSGGMNSVSFRNTLENWKMYPKDNPEDVVVAGALINEDAGESIDEVPSEIDWLLFSIKEKSENILPLTFRSAPLKKGEQVYIVGWRYSDKNCSQRIYEGNFVRSEQGTVLISTKELADNKMPGLSGAPVIDANGDLIGIMSRKAGKLERLSSMDYPRAVLGRIRR
jgi:hypothetical protein